MDLVQSTLFVKDLERGQFMYTTETGMPVGPMAYVFLSKDWAKYDIDKDGRLDFQEWIDCIRAGR